MTSNKRRRHTPDQIIRKLAEGNKLLGSGQELDAVCRHLEIAESKWHRWVAELTRKKLQRSAHRSVKELNSDLDTWTATWNEDPKPFVWHKTADQILDSLKKYLVNF